jgi:hypothetical protein
MLKSILLLLLVLAAVTFQNCAMPYDVHDDKPKVNHVTDPTFIPYIQDFEQRSGQSVAHIPIAFVDLGGNNAGLCYRGFTNGHLSYAYIEIDQRYWSFMTEYQRINLIFHELGHCFLQRKHVTINITAPVTSACPTSFMHDTVMSQFCLEQYYDVYMKEMFP